MTRLNAAPVKKQPTQATVRLRFQFMGAGDDITVHVTRVTREELAIENNKPANYAPG